MSHYFNFNNSMSLRSWVFETVFKKKKKSYKINVEDEMKVAVINPIPRLEKSCRSNRHTYPISK